MLQGSKRERHHIAGTPVEQVCFKGVKRERHHIARTPVEQVCFKGVKERDITLLGLQ